MSKLANALIIVSNKIDALPEEKRRSLEKTLKTLSPDELVTYMNWQAELFASGNVQIEDAQFMYNTLKDWEESPLPSRVIVIEIMNAYAQKKLNRMGRGRLVKSTKSKTRKRTTYKKREDQPWKIVATTPRFEGGAGGRPFRYVTLEWSKGGRKEYSRHMEVEDGEMYYGHYYQRKEDAVYDMNKSYRDELQFSAPLKARKTQRRRIKRKN